jgi:formylglycine-generating enzyme
VQSACKILYKVYHAIFYVCESHRLGRSFVATLLKFLYHFVDIHIDLEGKAMKLKNLYMAFTFIVAYTMAAQAITIDLVPVSNPGNAGKLSGSGAGGYGMSRICGAVNYSYQIGKFEITAGQYTAFLNAVAAMDTYGLYVSSNNGIQRSGSSGSYTYQITDADYPVTNVSWGDAARFCNWLHNGQPIGSQGLKTTEDGSYYLNGATTDVALMAVTRKSNATYVIPSEDEWYKAAYHKNDGITGNYFDYPTSSDVMPYSDNPLSLNYPTNSANYFNDDGISDNGVNDGYAVSPSKLTNVGSYNQSLSPYGTLDQGGNVFEFIEDTSSRSDMFRSARGGGKYSSSSDLYANNRDQLVFRPSLKMNIGIRVAYVPEPTSFVVLTGFAFIGLLHYWRRNV